MYVLAGCAADAVSYEASTYGQGLLTHSLLMGMQGAALREDQFVDVSGLFDFAADRVPELARDIGGIQRPVVASPRGGASFDIGQVAEEDKSAIPLQAPRPLVLCVNFQDEFDFVDTLLLGNLVNQQLRDISTRSPHAPLIFVDTAQFPSAYRLGGRYEVVGDTVSVRVVLSGGEEPQRFTVDGTKSDIQRLAEKIVQETQERLPTEQQ